MYVNHGSTMDVPERELFRLGRKSSTASSATMTSSNLGPTKACKVPLPLCAQSVMQCRPEPANKQAAPKRPSTQSPAVLVVVPGMMPAWLPGDCVLPTVNRTVPL